MDLALYIGSPVDTLARSMSEKELRQWHRYRSQKLLPFDRIELYLAQLASIIAATMGGHKNAKISDYLIELKPIAEPEGEEDERTVEEIREEAADAFGFNPRRKA